MVEYLNSITLQLVDDLHTEKIKIRFLCNSLLGKKWKTMLLKNISTIQHFFGKLVITLIDNIQLEHEIERLALPSNHTATSSQDVVRTYVNMILHIEVTQETMEITDPNDTKIPTGLIIAISQTAQDVLIASRDTILEARTDFETTYGIVLTTHALQVTFALEIILSPWRNEYLRTYSSFCNISYIVCGSSNIHLQVENFTQSLEQIETNLMNRSFLAHQAEAMTQLHSSRIVSRIRYK